MDKLPRPLLLVALLILLGVLLYIPKFKTNKGIIKPAQLEASNMQALPQEPIEKLDFLNELFHDVKPPEWVSGNLLAASAKSNSDSLNKLLKWAQETKNTPGVGLVQSQLAELQGGEENLTTAARTLIFTASENVDHPVVAAYLFQQGKRLLDIVLSKNKKNIPARNALVVYQSEYENQPMKFLGTLRESLALDSNNIETHFLRLNLLRKSSQWKKAVDECQKLISLQPRNPVWYFQASDIYGFMGDSVNAKVFLDLAVKVQNKEKQ